MQRLECFARSCNIKTAFAEILGLRHPRYLHVRLTTIQHQSVTVENDSRCYWLRSVTRHGIRKFLVVSGEFHCERLWKDPHRINPASNSTKKQEYIAANSNSKYYFCGSNCYSRYGCSVWDFVCKKVVGRTTFEEPGIRNFHQRRLETAEY